MKKRTSDRFFSTTNLSEVITRLKEEEEEEEEEEEIY
jgi:hypothetical protein